ncbi:MAG: hypothetical protein AAF907_06290 [Planctomycetota bacterium]
MSDSIPSAGRSFPEQAFGLLLEEAPETVAGFVRPVLPPAGSSEPLHDRVGETTAEGEAILPRLRETPGDRLLRDHPGRPALIVKAGLLLLHGDLDHAHRLVQSFEGDRDADAWHALVHRLEGDYGNSGYWWSRVGDHPFFNCLAKEHYVRRWDPQAFTERYRTVLRNGTDEERSLVKATQAAEFALLLRHCLT